MPVLVLGDWEPNLAGFTRCYWDIDKAVSTTGTLRGFCPSLQVDHMHLKPPPRLFPVFKYNVFRRLEALLGVP